MARPGRPPSRSWSRPARPRWSPYAVHAAAGDPGRSRPSRRAGPVCRTRGRSWSRSPWPPRPRRPDQRWLDLCAGPGGKAALLAALAAGRGAAAAGRRTAGAPGRPGAPPPAVPPGVLGVVTADGTRPPWPPARSTGCWWTRPAPASAPSGGAPRRAGAGAHRPRRARTAPAGPAVLGARRRPPGRRGRSTRPAPRCWPRRPAWSPPCWRAGDDVDLEDARAAAARRTRLRRPAARHRAAVAAPARHRRDVPGPAPPS